MSEFQQQANEHRDKVWTTGNAQLAFAAFSAGCKPALQADGGPASNVYTLGFFRQPRMSWAKGMTLEDAAKEAIRRGIPGNVTYAIERSPELDEVIAAWDAMAKEQRTATEEKRAPEMPNIPPKVIAQVLYAATLSTAEFKKLPFLNRMCQIISTMDGKTREKDGEKVTEGAGKVRSIYASDATKQRLKF